ncbi:MAG: type II toxin-antitoxin system VapC family toxin [Coriobacteriia bacterium]|nr:type II toxin-antitoxin system VapC family toxin [Coriobacteriia bacterium]MCL2537464.1 type II toxin-antitoxin system VapC family toxin [Coriobacteriia bacterium]
MKLLLDTHAFLWSMASVNRLSQTAEEAIVDLANELYVSSISFYEITYKIRIGKMPDIKVSSSKPHDFLLRLGAHELPVSSLHAAGAGSMEWNHADPFDRILAAQALCDDLHLVTIDKEFSSLPDLKTIW